MSQESSTKTRLLTARWVVPIIEPPIVNGGVLVKGERIAQVGPADELKAAHPEAEHKDYGLGVIMPGLVNAHTQLDMSVFRGLCEDLPFSAWLTQVVEKGRLLNPADWLTSAYLGTLEAMRAGITCVGDFSMDGAGLQAARTAGLRGIIYHQVMGMKRSEVEKTIAAALSAIEDQRTQAGDLLEVGVAPDSPYSVCPELYRDLSALAREKQIPLATRLAESRDEFEFVKYGSSPLAHEYKQLMGWGDVLWQPMGCSPVTYLAKWGVFEGPVLAVHCVHVDARDLDLLEENGVAVVHCPRSNAKLAAGIAPLSGLVQRGLSVGLGTDTLASSLSMDLFDEMRIGLLLHRGCERRVDQLGAERFVRMATLGGAEALGLEDRIGTLEAEKAADLIVVDLSRSRQTPVDEPYSALVYTATEEDVLLTMVAGRVLFDGETWTTLDGNSVKSQARELRGRMVGR